MYISTSNLGDGQFETSVASVLKVSKENNAMRGLTGALVFTGEHFVQALEGDEASLDGLMSILAMDSRHSCIRIVQDGPLAARRFANWSMAYVGPSKFVTRQIRRLLSDPSAAEASRAVGWLETLLVDTTLTTQAT